MDIAVEDNRRRIKAWKRHIPAMRSQYCERDILALTKRVPTLQLHLFKCNRLISKGSIANESYYTPFDIVFAIKENNMGKLSSHLWIMRGFSRQLNPEFITLLDVGTKPMPTALIQLYNEMEENPQLGGCCGEILVCFYFRKGAFMIDSSLYYIGIERIESLPGPICPVL